MGSDESHFNVSLIVWGTKSQDSVHRPQLLRERTAEADSKRGPSVYQPNALPRGQTGSGAIILPAWFINVKGNERTSQNAFYFYPLMARVFHFALHLLVPTQTNKH